MTPKLSPLLTSLINSTARELHVDADWVINTALREYFGVVGDEDKRDTEEEK